jgi:hypothetical protein
LGIHCNLYPTTRLGGGQPEQIKQSDQWNPWPWAIENLNICGVYRNTHFKDQYFHTEAKRNTHIKKINMNCQYTSFAPLRNAVTCPNFYPTKWQFDELVYIREPDSSGSWIWSTSLNTIDLNLYPYTHHKCSSFQSPKARDFTGQIVLSVQEHKKSYGPSWSHGSWIYNYLCNQCLLPLT